jgi:antitoxin component YwqK of YwqJK toxin-antitoxin module
VYYAYARFNNGSLEYEGWIQDQDSMETKYGRWRHYYKGGQVWRIEDKPINHTDSSHQQLYNKKGELTYEFSFLLKEPSPRGNSYSSTMDIYSVSNYLSVRTYKQGKLKSIKNWKGDNLKKEGEWLFFDENEKIVKEKQYLNGKLLSSKKF